MKAGYQQRLTRWMVEHPRVVVGVGIVLWLGLCVVVFRWGMGFSKDPRELPAGMAWLAHVRAWGGWVMSAAALGWLAYCFRRCDKEARPAGPGRPERPTLSSLMYRRIYEREPVPKKLLPWFGCVGFAGVGIGVALTLWIALATSGGGMDKWRGVLITLALLALACVGSGVGVLRDVFFLADDDYFVGNREEEVVAELEATAQREAQTEREYDRKKLPGWQAWLLYVGFLGGGMLMFKQLGEPAGIVAFQVSVAALVVCAVWLYTGRLRPRHGRAGRVLTLVGAAAFLAFTFHSWGFLWVPVLLGLAWGGAVGLVSTVLYLRRLESQPQSSTQSGPSVSRTD